jgi:hypothetical protein
MVRHPHTWSRALTTPAAPPPDPAASWEHFRQLLPADYLNALDPKAAQAAYTPFVVVWLLVYQRLHGNASLREAVAEFTQRFPDHLLPDCKRAQEHTLSTNTGAYSDARSVLDKTVLPAAADRVYTTLLSTYPPSWRDRRVFAVDGSTISLPATAALRAAYPPASNQHGASHWPILHVAVVHELASGLAIRPAFGPMYGPHAVSETALARQLLAQVPADAILLGDRNFGIFAFAWAAQQARHDVLLRLTAVRFRALQKKARAAGAGKWELTWHPSKADRQADPNLPADAALHGWLHEVVVSEKRTLWLFETMDATGEEMAALYRQRWHVETDLRDLKRTLKLDVLTGRSVQMVEKELVAGVLAYNLTNQIRRLAAARLQLPPRRLSFAGTWSLLQSFLEGVGEWSLAEAEARFERLLRGVGQQKLPNRPGRSAPREVIPRRRKFPERRRTTAPKPDPQ